MEVAPHPGWSGKCQSLSAVGYRGKRLRLSGFVRADAVTGNDAGLWMRIDSPLRTTAFDNMIDFGRPILGDAERTRQSVVLDVSNDAIGITFGLLLSGGGVARVDDMTLEVVDVSASTTGTADAAPDGGDSTALVGYHTPPYSRPMVHP